MPETVTTFCRVRGTLRGRQIARAGGRIVAVDPDPDHVATDGFACVNDSWSGIAPD